MTRYWRPTSLDEALAIRAQAGADLAMLAGGTDLYPARAQRTAWSGPDCRPILDLTSVPGLGGVELAPDGSLRIGALTDWTAIADAPLPPAFDMLRQAARQVGGVQIQNRGTLGGNLCNASPAADGGPPLLALDASVELASVRGRRTLRLGEFLLGNRRTALAQNELLVAVTVPPPPADVASTFLKLGARSYLVISIVSVAALVALDPAGRIAAARIAVGACSAVPARLSRLEERLAGMSAEEAATLRPEPDDLAPLSPIDDVRAGAAYRMAAAGHLVGRALAGLAGPARRQAA